MGADFADTLLAQTTESRKYPTDDKIVAIAGSTSCQIVAAGGHSTDGKGIMHCLGIEGSLRWSQTYPHPIQAVGVSLRGNYVGLGGVDNILYYFTNVGELEWTNDCRADIKSIEISGSGRFLLAGLSDGNILYFDNEIVAARKFAWKHKFDKPVSAISINNEGTLVGAATEEGEIAVFTERGDLVWTKLLEGRVNAFRMAHEGDAVVAACDDNCLRYYSAEIGRTLWTGNAGGVMIDADITRRGERAVGISKDNFVYCHDKAGGLLWKYDLGVPGEMVRISLDGKTVVAVGIDTSVHCIDAKGNLMWKYRTGGSTVSGLMVSEDGDLVIVICDAGVLYFENLQVVGGILPKVRHEVSKKQATGAPVFKCENLYEEATVALNYGDYQTAAAKIRDIEASLRPKAAVQPQPEPPVPLPQPPAELLGMQPPPKPAEAEKPAAPEEGADRKIELQATIDAILKGSEELKKNGVNVEPVENLLGEAMVFLEDENFTEAEAFISDAREMLSDFGGTMGPVEVAPPEPAPLETGGTKEEALEVVEKASEMLSDLESTDIGLEQIRADIEEARDHIGSAEYQKSIVTANKAVVAMEEALDPYIMRSLMSVQQLMAIAEKRGVETGEAKERLSKTGDQMAAGDHFGALNTVKEVEGWLETTLKEKEMEPPTPVEPEVPEKPVEPEVPEKPAEPEVPEKPVEPVTEGKPPSIIPPIPSMEGVLGPKEGKPDEPSKPPIVVPIPPFDGEVGPKPMGLGGSLTVSEEARSLSEADRALETGDVGRAVGLYIIAMEAVEGKARTAVEKVIDDARAKVSQVKEDGLDTTEAEDLIARAEEALGSGDYRGAVDDAKLALEKAEGAAAGEVTKLIEEAKRNIEVATNLGVDIAMAEDLIRNAEEAISKEEYAVAMEFADKTVAELDKASTESVTRVIDEGADLLNKATDLGIEVGEVRASFDNARKALDEKDYKKAHELAAAAVEEAKGLPRRFVQDRISEARSKVLAVEKIGAETMMAKNFLIRARSSMAAGDHAAALTACDKCVEELDKAPKNLVNKRIAAAKSTMERVRATGHDTFEVEGRLKEAEEKVADGAFEEAVGILEEVTSRLKEMESISADITNVLFDIDMAVVQAAEEGKDVKDARAKLDEAFAIRSQDPARAKELALEVKNILEGL